MDLTVKTGGPGFGGSRIFQIAAAVAACHRWAYTMQSRYDRLGARGFQRGAALEALMADLDPVSRAR